jgi:cobalt/nickel transport system permease protein
MKHGIDRYAELESPVHRWDPRLKLVGLGALAFACAFVTDLRLVPLMLAISAGLAALSRLPLEFVIGRLRYPGVLVLLLAVILPFFSGETVLVRLGPLSLRHEGILDFLLIAGRFVAIVTLGLVAFATAPMLTSITALRALRLPGVLADMMLFSYRYLYELGDDLDRMRTAARLRGFRPRRPDPHSLATLGALTGSLLVRSHDQSTRIHQAMILRGYGTTKRNHHHFHAGPRDIVALVATMLLAAGLVLLEVL